MLDILEKVGWWPAVPYDIQNYHSFEVAKPNGKKRLIEDPHPQLKQLQRNLIPILLKFPLHPAVYGLGGANKNSIENAKQHINRVIFKTDIEKFFPNTTLEKFRYAILLDPQEIYERMAAICFVQDKSVIRLPTGAPTSPLIASITFTLVDHELSDLATLHGLTYTRYVDDITFSGAAFPSGLQKTINNIITHYNYRCSQKKTKLMYCNNSQQKITGVVVNRKPSVGKEYKRLLRAEIDHHVKTRAPLSPYLIGKINYIKQVNHEQYISILDYYNRKKEHYHDT